jgi:hypothetical protein
VVSEGHARVLEEVLVVIGMRAVLIEKVCEHIHTGSRR